MKKLAELSAFFPFWNEEENIELVIESAARILPDVADKWEIIIIDDGSSDTTLEKAKKLENGKNNYQIVSHMPNRGYGASLKEGLTNAKYKYVVFSDGDGQFDFSEVTRFVEKIESADIVIGFREKRHDQPFRHILMNMLKIWDLLFFRFYFRDIDCGFKMFKREALETIGPLESEGAMITTEILAKAKKKKLKIVQVGVSHYPRKFGNQSGGNIRVIIRAVIESLNLWYDLHYGRA